MKKSRLHKLKSHGKKKWFFFLLIVIVGGVFLYLMTIRTNTSSQSVAELKNSTVEVDDEEEEHDGYEEPVPEKQALIKIKNNKFVPEKILVDSGTIIVFENEDRHEHVAVSDNYERKDEIVFDTGKLPHKEKVKAIEYGIPGTYPYHDKLNTAIKGIIVVQE